MSRLTWPHVALAAVIGATAIAGLWAGAQIGLQALTSGGCG